MTSAQKRVMFVLLALFTLLQFPSALAAEDFTLTAPSQVSLCPCSGQGYKLLLTNTGSEASSYSILIDTQSQKSVSVSPKTLSLDAGKAAEIIAYVTSPCSAVSQNITFTVSTQKGLAKALTHIVQFKPCYQFTLTPGRPLNDTMDKTVDFTAVTGSYSFCKGTERTIPLLIVNEDTSFDNSYSLSIIGAPYASLSTSQFSLKKGASGIVLLDADMRSIDSSSDTATITIRSEKGSRQLQRNLSIAVRDCYGVEASFGAVPPTVCAGEPLSIPFSIKNTGNFQKRYGLEIEGPIFASLSQNWLEVGAQSMKDVQLALSAPADFSGDAQVSITAVQLDAPAITSSDGVSILYEPYASCHSLSIRAKDSFKVSSKGHLPLTFNNEGSQEQSVTWAVSGVDWAEMSGAQATLKPMQSRHEVLFLSPSGDVEKGEYALTINLTSEKTSASKTIIIEVTDDTQSLAALKYYAYAYRYYFYLLALVLLALFLARKKISKEMERRRAKREAEEKRMAKRAKLQSKKAAQKGIIAQQGAPLFSFKSMALLLLAILLGALIAIYPTAVFLFLRSSGTQLLIAAVLIALFWFFVLRPTLRKRRKKSVSSKGKK